MATLRQVLCSGRNNIQRVSQHTICTLHTIRLYSILLAHCRKVSESLPIICYNVRLCSLRNPLLHSINFSSIRNFCSQKQRKNVIELSIEEALYCAKEAGIYTTAELQKQIITSSPFSPNKNPFLIENFFDSLQDDSEDDEDENLNVEQPLEEHNVEDHDDSVDESGFSLKTACQVIDNKIVENFNPSCYQTFSWNGRKWLVQSEGRGTRKRAAAHVIIRRGTGQVRVNNDEDLYIRWPYIYNRMDVIQPFYLTKTAGIYDLFIHTRGGGPSGQSGAVRLAVGRALVNACHECAADLAEDMVLYEDTRQKMPKMPGRKSARKQKAWSKR